MSDSSATATVVDQSLFLHACATSKPESRCSRSMTRTASTWSPTATTRRRDIANCAIRVHIEVSSDSNPGPLPFTETQDVELRNRLPGGTWMCREVVDNAGAPTSAAT